MYCGKNALKQNKGTNYSCLKKGIGIGLQKNSFEVYISKKTNSQKMYCGNKSIVPENEITGNLLDCLRKGVGVGIGISFSKNLDKLISDIDHLIQNNNSEV